MMDMRDIDLYNAMINERQAEILDQIKRHTLLKGSQAPGNRRKALLALLGIAALLALAFLATGAQFFV
jgi:hypothetical protein